MLYLKARYTNARTPSCCGAHIRNESADVVHECPYVNQGSQRSEQFDEATICPRMQCTSALMSPQRVAR
eukprot:3074249-Pyramimonas_sp.AAC.1